MLFRCPECRTRRRDCGLFTKHLKTTGHALCHCGGYHYAHRKGSPYCESNPMSDVWLASRQGTPDTEHRIGRHCRMVCLHKAGQGHAGGRVSVLMSIKWFPERLKDLRHEKRWTLAELSRRSSVSTSSLCRYEKGESWLGLYDLALVCDALGVTIDELLNIPPYGAWLH